MAAGLFVDSSGNLAISSDGKLRIGADGDPCCCGGCITSAPSTITLCFSGYTNCPGSAYSLNGTWTLPYIGTYGGVSTYILTGPTYPTGPYGPITQQLFATVSTGTDGCLRIRNIYDNAATFYNYGSLTDADSKLSATASVTLPNQNPASSCTGSYGYGASVDVITP